LFNSNHRSCAHIQCPSFETAKKKDKHININQKQIYIIINRKHK
jgi:hypothetical protein